MRRGYETPTSCRACGSSRQIFRAELVGALASARIGAHRRGADAFAIGVECAEHAWLIPIHRRIQLLQRVFGDEERPFQGGVVAPKADGAPGRVVAAAVVWKH